MKRYICGLCRKKKKVEDFISTRAGLRNHLKEEHFIKTQITNTTEHRHSARKSEQDHWITEEI